MGDEIRDAIERLMPMERMRPANIYDNDARLMTILNRNRTFITHVDWYPEPVDQSKIQVLYDGADLGIWIEQPSRARGRGLSDKP